MHQYGGSTGSGGWFRRRRTRVDVDPRVPALLDDLIVRLGRYLERGGPDAPTWVTEMGALERHLTHLTAGTRDRPLHGLLRDLIRQMSAVYSSAPGLYCELPPAGTAALFDALEAAEALAYKARRRAAELQGTPVRSTVPS